MEDTASVLDMRCPVCDVSVPRTHRAHRGLLINALASVKASLITGREMLTQLRRRQESRDPAQRAHELASLLNLQAAVIRDEERLRGLERLEEVSTVEEVIDIRDYRRESWREASRIERRDGSVLHVYVDDSSGQVEFVQVNASGEAATFTLRSDEASNVVDALRVSR